MDECFIDQLDYLCSPERVRQLLRLDGESCIVELLLRIDCAWSAASVRGQLWDYTLSPEVTASVAPPSILITWGLANRLYIIYLTTKMLSDEGALAKYPHLCVGP